MSFADTRIGGVTKYYAYRPKDWNMRIPEDILSCVCFLGIRLTAGPDAGKFYTLGTGFFIEVAESDISFSYLVTARHVLDEARRAGYTNLIVRLNTKNGGAQYVDAPEHARWLTLDNEAIDVAVLPFGPDQKVFSFKTLPIEMLVDDQRIHDLGIGIGDELFTVGLFVRRAGKQRNIPIVRTGVIAAMPSEPFTRKGKQYHAYLAEMRSIGGLSGSPVFVYIDKARLVKAKFPEGPDVVILCLGLIRGHWDLERDLSSDISMPTDDVQLGLSKGEKLNTGIAVVTPSHYILAILNNDEVKDIRKKTVESIEAQHEPTEDAPLTKHDTELTRHGFERTPSASKAQE